MVSVFQMVSRSLKSVSVLGKGDLSTGEGFCHVYDQSLHVGNLLWLVRGPVTGLGTSWYGVSFGKLSIPLISH